MQINLSTTILLVFAVLAVGSVSAEHVDHRSHLTVTTEEQSKKMLAVGALRTAMRRNDDFFQLRQLSSELFLFLQRTPSIPQALGRCGSGTEDFLVLISLKNKHAAIVDREMLQSCVDNVDLVTENPTDVQGLLEGISFDDKNKTIRFSISQYIEGEEHNKEQVLGIKGDKFLLKK